MRYLGNKESIVNEIDNLLTEKDWTKMVYLFLMLSVVLDQ